MQLLDVSKSDFRALRVILIDKNEILSIKNRTKERGSVDHLRKQKQIRKLNAECNATVNYRYME